MIKARSSDEAGQPIVILGITGENVARMAAGEPVLVNMTELGLPPMKVILMYGKTERHITAELELHGLLPPGTASDMAEPKPSKEGEG